jgi:hypothetical protein
MMSATKSSQKLRTTRSIAQTNAADLQQTKEQWSGTTREEPSSLDQLDIALYARQS